MCQHRDGEFLGYLGRQEVLLGMPQCRGDWGACASIVRDAIAPKSTGHTHITGEPALASRSFLDRLECKMWFSYRDGTVLESTGHT